VTPGLQGNDLKVGWGGEGRGEVKCESKDGMIQQCAYTFTQMVSRASTFDFTTFVPRLLNVHATILLYSLGVFL